MGPDPKCPFQRGWREAVWPVIRQNMEQKGITVQNPNTVTLFEDEYDALVAAAKRLSVMEEQAKRNIQRLTDMEGRIEALSTIRVIVDDSAPAGAITFRQGDKTLGRIEDIGTSTARSLEHDEAVRRADAAERENIHLHNTVSLLRDKLAKANDPAIVEAHRKEARLQGIEEAIDIIHESEPDLHESRAQWIANLVNSVRRVM